MKLSTSATMNILLLAIGGMLSAANARHDNATLLPIVDLDYAIHQATAFNATGDYYTFSNIRFAAPPVGELRFAKPHPPTVNRSIIETGSQGHSCPEVIPNWLSVSEDFAPRYLAGQTHFNETSARSFIAPTTPFSLDPGSSEDCLFLDVVVPKRTLDIAGKRYGSPVLVWIYGGGFTLGNKNNVEPAGLLHASQRMSTDGLIFVAFNYRLGAFGWLSGSTLQSNGTANAGLLDQRMALDWVQTNIAKFGGDPNRITVMGESAGGGSIMHHITASGGKKGSVPFAQAILQSPGHRPVISNQEQERTFEDFLHLSNVSTIQEARQLPSAVLQRANFLQVTSAPYSSFIFGPTVDGDVVHALPVQLLSRGLFDRSLRIMVGHNDDEGLLFTSPYLQSTADMEGFLVDLFPALQGARKTLDYIFKTLYPPIYNGSLAQGYTNPIARMSTLLSELKFLSNTYALCKAYRNAYAYKFAVPPALHGGDVAYTFSNGRSDGKDSSVTATLQSYITTFAMTGSPNSPHAPFFGNYGINATIQVLNTTNIYETIDDSANERCTWWQKALYV